MCTSQNPYTDIEILILTFNLAIIFGIQNLEQ